MPRVTTKNQVTLHVKDWGTGQPVIMIHGWPLSADTFDDLAMAMADAGFAPSPTTAAGSAARSNLGRLRLRHAGR